MNTSENSSSPILNEHWSAQWCQFLCCHQLADQGMALRIQAAGLRCIAKQVRQELVVLGNRAAYILLPKSRCVAVQLHRATAGRGERRKMDYKEEQYWHNVSLTLRTQNVGALNVV